MGTRRLVVWFSAGAPSAVVARLCVREMSEQYDVVVARIVIKNEHEDNDRFAADVSRWIGQPIIELRSSRYKDCWDVWEKRRYLAGPKGALCTTEMKKMVRHAFQQPDDVQAFGYAADETERAARFREQNFEVDLLTPLIERGLTRPDCKAVLSAAGIELPAMYRLGYLNNNCIGCVKGGAGYWNKIRVDFPEIFDRMAELQRDIGATTIKHKGKRIYLDELPPDAGRMSREPDIECSLLCQGIA